METFLCRRASALWRRRVGDGQGDGVEGLLTRVRSVGVGYGVIGAVDAVNLTELGRRARLLRSQVVVGAGWWDVGRGAGAPGRRVVRGRCRRQAGERGGRLWRRCRAAPRSWAVGARCGVWAQGGGGAVPVCCCRGVWLLVLRLGRHSRARYSQCYGGRLLRRRTWCAMGALTGWRLGCVGPRPWLWERVAQGGGRNGMPRADWVGGASWELPVDPWWSFQMRNAPSILARSPAGRAAEAKCASGGSALSVALVPR